MCFLFFFFFLPFLLSAVDPVACSKSYSSQFALTTCPAAVTTTPNTWEKCTVHFSLHFPHQRIHLSNSIRPPPTKKRNKGLKKKEKPSTQASWASTGWCLISLPLLIFCSSVHSLISKKKPPLLGRSIYLLHLVLGVCVLELWKQDA